MPRKLKWSNLLNISELDFIPGPPAELQVSDELLQAICWLTAATQHDRRFLRCTELGALLTGNGWDNLTSVEVDVLYPTDGSPDSHITSVANKGVLVSTSTVIIKASFVRVASGVAEHIYIPPGVLYFYPHSFYSVTASVVPASGGTAGYVGITSFN